MADIDDVDDSDASAVNNWPRAVAVKLDVDDSDAAAPYPTAALAVSDDVDDNDADPVTGPAIVTRNPAEFEAAGDIVGVRVPVAPAAVRACCPTWIVEVLEPVFTVCCVVPVIAGSSVNVAAVPLEVLLIAIARSRHCDRTAVTDGSTTLVVPVIGDVAPTASSGLDRSAPVILPIAITQRFAPPLVENV